MRGTRPAEVSIAQLSCGLYTTQMGFRVIFTLVPLLFWLGETALADDPKELTASEQAILDTFLTERPKLRTQDTPADVATRPVSNLWLETLREDSQQRLVERLPELPALLERAGKPDKATSGRFCGRRKTHLPTRAWSPTRRGRC